MKRFSTDAGNGWIRLLVFVSLSSMASAVGATQLSSARVTQVIKDVKLLPRQAAARAAALNDEVAIGTAVRTGTDSRTELTFGDLTIARLGANTIFSFNQEKREINLNEGAILVSVPRNGASASISTAAVTAAISGGTAFFECHKLMPAKLLVLEGLGEFCSKRYPGECTTVHGGEMAMMDIDGHLTRPTKFNAALVYKTSKLITSFSPLPNADLIEAVIDQQQAESGQTSGSSSSSSTKDPIDVISTSTTANGSSSGAGAKYGPPSAITSPNPYVIMNGTAINTDPTITTNGITNFGKIYRGAAIDGPLATWLGSSPSSFDSLDFVNSNGGGFNNPDMHPIPGFLFASLTLDGDPTVSNSNGYPLLAFVSQGSIFTNPTGAVLTFGGMNQVALVALNGSMELSGVSFANFGELFVYARGAGSTLTMAAPSNLNRVELRSEGNLDVNASQTLNGNVQDHRGFKALAGNNLGVNANVISTGGGITLQALGGITINSSAQIQALLDSMGNGGGVIILASGSDTAVHVSGTVQADQNEVDIRQTGVAGMTTLNNAIVHGDVVKISALGANGTLNIGSGNVLGADTILKLYAPGSNGTLNFLSNVTITSPTNIFAANTINISTGVVVTINSVNKADVYTNNPNYNFVPQPGYSGPPPNATNGTFSGAGANDPRPLINAPPLGAPGQGP